MARSLRALLGPTMVLAFALLPVSCAYPGERAMVAAAPIPAERTVHAGDHTDHVILISIDGLRPDAIARYRATTLQRLIAEGSHSFEATTIMPSKTLPSHTSMLTGTELETHGVTWNDDRMNDRGHLATATIFGSAKQAGFHTAAFFSKSKFQYLVAPNTLDHARVPGGLLGMSRAASTVDAVTRYLNEHRPNLLFVHLGEPDFVGHTVGWMTTPYGWAVRKVDEEIGRLLRAADHAFGARNYTVLITADHGGHRRGHGSADPRDVTIPWIAWGKGVAAGTSLEPGIRTMDTAATVLWLLGAEPGLESVGRVVTAAFTAAETSAVAEVP